MGIVDSSDTVAIDSFDMGDALDVWMKVAKKQRSAIPYSHDEQFPNTVIVIGPNLQVVAQPVTWSDNREKYLKMKAWAEAAKMSDARALALVSDTRWTESDVFADYFKIPNVKDLGVEEYSKIYNQILHKPPYNGEVKNLPRQLWNEAIVIAMKGPRMKMQTRFARYVEGPRDTIQWLLPVPGMEYKETQFNLVPDWWV